MARARTMRGSQAIQDPMEWIPGHQAGGVPTRVGLVGSNSRWEIWWRNRHELISEWYYDRKFPKHISLKCALVSFSETSNFGCIWEFYEVVQSCILEPNTYGFVPDFLVDKLESNTCVKHGFHNVNQTFDFSIIWNTTLDTYRFTILGTIEYKSVILHACRCSMIHDVFHDALGSCRFGILLSLGAPRQCDGHVGECDIGDVVG